MQATQRTTNFNAPPRAGEADAERQAALSALGDPGEVEFRETLRSFLTIVLADPGQLVNPVYIGPILHATELEQEIATLAEVFRIRQVARNDVGVRAGDMHGVALLNEQEAGRLAQYGVRPANSVQVIVWGRKVASDLSAALREWLSVGIELDPNQPGMRGECRPIQEAVARIASARTGEPRCLVWVGPEQALAALGAEVRVRLEIAGCGPVTDPVSEPAAPKSGSGKPGPGSVLIVLRGAAGAAEAWSRVQAAHGRGARVVVLADPDAETGLRALDAAQGVAEAAWGWEADTAPGARERDWPALEEALIGAAPSVTPREGLSVFPLRMVPMSEVLTAPALEQATGTLVVFEARRLAWIRMTGGEIRDARRVQENRPAGTATEIVARLRDISRWPDAQAVFVPGYLPVEGEEPTGGGCRIPLQAAAFDLLSLGSSSTGFASREQSADQVARGLASFGLVKEAVQVLEAAARNKELGPAGASLMASLRTADQPRVAAESFRDAVRHAAGEPGEEGFHLAVDAGLNALLVEVRAGIRSVASAWALIRRAGLTSPSLLGDEPARLGVVMELALRAARYDVAQQLAGRIRQADPETIPPVWSALAAEIAVDPAAPAAEPPPVEPAPSVATAEVANG